MYNNRYRFKGRKVVMMIFFGAIALLVFGFIVMTLWNAILPQTVNVKPINFGQALGIFLLAKILFGGFHGRWGGARRWPQHMQERWAAMNPEEREKLRSEWKNRCRGWKEKGEQKENN